MRKITIFSTRTSLYNQSYLISKTQMECIVVFIPLVCNNISYFYPSCYHFGFATIYEVSSFYIDKYSSGELRIGSLCVTDRLSCGKRFLLFPIASGEKSGVNSRHYEAGIRWIVSNVGMFSGIAFPPNVLYGGLRSIFRLNVERYLSEIAVRFLYLDVDVEVYVWGGVWWSYG